MSNILSRHLPFQKAKVFLGIAYSLPILLIFWFVTSFTVNIPVWDDWELVYLFNKIYSGTASFSDFFAQHNEHRIFFPRIIFAILAFSSKWNIKLETYFSLLLALVNFAVLYKIAAHSSNKNNKLLFHLFNLTTCVVNFSLLQYENWLWGFQIAWLLINTCLILAVFILTVPKNLHPNFRLSLASLCCIIASFSSAHGLLSWLVLLPSVYLVEGITKQKKIRILVWLVLFAFCVAIYSINYEKPSHHPSIFFIFQQPLIGVKYFFVMIGFSLGKTILTPMVNGLIIFSNFSFFNIYCFKNYQSVFFGKAVPWLSLGWFAVLFVLITTLGRAGFGIETATSSRYVTVSILLVISCLQLCRLWIVYKWQDAVKNTHVYSGLCLGFLICIFVFSSKSCIVQGKNIWKGNNAAKHCLEVINFIDTKSPNNCLHMFYPDPLKIVESSKTLQKLGFRNFQTNIIFTTKTAKSYGNIDVPPTVDRPLIIRRNDTIKFLGWGIIPERQKQPFLVLLSYGNNQSFFGYGTIFLNRPDVAKAFNSSLYDTSGWEANVSLKSIPLGETVIKAWVYDQESQQFIQLNGETKIKVVE
ncbi:Glycosyltransferase RgtA/B/C/D-like domain-containing protein [Nostoc sp. DSM 114161]|jgi:hypothetical protein|uniref:hypothetical protein n=1 Tax=Nostoc sp. DSM 114161 TaxID=3440143 RepID=UPI004045BB1D